MTKVHCMEEDAEMARFYGPYLAGLRRSIDDFTRALDAARSRRLGQGNRDVVAGVQSRVKSPASARSKLARRGFAGTGDNAVHMIRDAAGVRVIVPFVDDMAVVVEMVRDMALFDVVLEKDYVSHPKANGYRSYHLILRETWLPGTYAVRPGSPESMAPWLEVQVRTLAMDCWASIEHLIGYKCELVDQRLMTSELKRCADEIASTDLSLQTLADIIDGRGGGEAAAAGGKRVRRAG